MPCSALTNHVFQGRKGTQAKYSLDSEILCVGWLELDVWVFQWLMTQLNQSISAKYDFPIFHLYDVSALSWTCTLKEKVGYGGCKICQVQITRNFFHFHPATHTPTHSPEADSPKVLFKSLTCNSNKEIKEQEKKKKQSRFLFQLHKEIDNIELNHREAYWTANRKKSFRTHM